MIPYGTDRPLLTPVDRDGSRRSARLRRLGLGERADASFDSFDGFAGRVAEVTATPFSIVNFIDENRQFFAGLHTGALVLEDVCDYPRFAGNPVVDDMGIRSYLGAPLIDRTGVALGTVCAVDTVPRAWGRAGLDTIKLLAGEFVVQTERREAVNP
ncbi:GAF domain-containing protein [Streptomyces sp. NPDC091271]|uniref:GAF domain-containing protein n=1 Tax=Streptomyces sp. NPDC091271 TaxID=3365980 RepID=UPI003809BCD8